MLRRLATAIFAIAVFVVAPGSPKVLAAPGPSVTTLRAQGAAEVRDIFVRMPQGLADGQPLQVLVALHGMGGSGHDFGQALAAQADAHGWAIVAPTFAYGDWTDPTQITREDPALVAWLSDYLRRLGATLGIDNVATRVLLFGHSRGAQLALRFTEIHPEQVTAVAAVSAGTYTLPFARDSRGTMLKFPFGVGDLATFDGGQAFDERSFESVPVWIGVGGDDDHVGDVPSAWTPYLGDDRVERASTFAQALRDMGALVNLTVFPNADHTLTDDMRAAGCSALASAAA